LGKQNQQQQQNQNRFDRKGRKGRKGNWIKIKPKTKTKGSKRNFIPKLLRVPPLSSASLWQISLFSANSSLLWRFPSLRSRKGQKIEGKTEE
jgi:hypothetical protein